MKLVERYLRAWGQSVVGKALSHRFFKIPQDVKASLAADLPLIFVFTGDPAAQEIVARALKGAELVFVRPGKSGLFARSSIRIANRFKNSRLLFVDGAAMRAAERDLPSLARRCFLLSYGALQLGHASDRLVSLIVHDAQGNPSPEFFKGAISRSELSAWLGNPVFQSSIGPEQTARILFLDAGLSNGRSAEETKNAILNIYPNSEIVVDCETFRIGGGRGVGFSLDSDRKRFDLFVSNDPTVSAYLAHWGLACGILTSDGDIVPSGTMTSEGLVMVDTLLYCGLFDLKLRRPISLCNFLADKDGPFRRMRRTIAALDSAITSGPEKIGLFSVLFARRGDPSFAADIGYSLEQLVMRETASSKARGAKLRRMADRLLAMKVSKSEGHFAESVQSYVAQEDEAPVDALVERGGFGKGVRAWITKQADFRVGRLYARAVQLRPTRHISHLVAKRVAAYGIDAAFQYFVGMCGTPERAHQLANDIRASLKSNSHNDAIVCARLYLSVGRQSEALSVLNSFQFKTPGHHAFVLTSFYKTAEIDAGLDWFRALDADLRNKGPVASAAANLLLAKGSVEEAFQVLAESLRAAPKSGQGLKLLYAKVAGMLDRTEEQFSILDESVRSGNDNPDIVQRWARAVRNSGRMNAATWSLQNSESGTSSARASYLLSHLMAENGDLVGAQIAAMRAFRTDPASSVYIAQVVLASPAGAISLLRDALELHAATSADAKVRAAGHLIGVGDLGRAEALLIEAKRAAAEPFQLAQTFARLYLHKEEFDAAYRTLAKALAADPARLPLLLLAVDVAERRRDNETLRRLLDLCKLVAPGDHRVLAIHARLLEGQKNYSASERTLTQASDMRRANSVREDLRTNWQLFRLRAALRDPAGAKDAYDRLLTGLHELLPPEVRRWSGESLAGKSVLLLPRGGPGDELRALQIVLRHLTSMGANISFLGDARLKSIFERNFPACTFLVNPFAGSKLRAKEFARQGVPRLQAGTAEIARRLGLYVRSNTFHRFEYVMFTDDVFARVVLPDILSSVQPLASPLDIDPKVEAKAEEALAGLKGDGPIVTMSWRGSYFSPNRPSAAFLAISELGPILRVPNIRFVDTHPNTSDQERDEIRERYGVELYRPEGVDFQHDLDLVGAVMRRAEANIVPPVTQRDLAASVGARNIWSLTVMPGVTEDWRVNQQTHTDLWQPGISHHVLRNFNNSRRAVVEAIAGRVAGLS